MDVIITFLKYRRENFSDWRERSMRENWDIILTEIRAEILQEILHEFRARQNSGMTPPLPLVPSGPTNSALAARQMVKKWLKLPKLENIVSRLINGVRS